MRSARRKIHPDDFGPRAAAGHCLELETSPSWSLEDEQRTAEIDRRLAIIEATRYVYTTKQKSISGVMVGLAYNGELSIDYGLSNQRSSKNAEGGDDGSDGRQEETSDQEKISASLQEELTAQRTVALRAALMSRPDVALVAITHNSLLVPLKGFLVSATMPADR